MRKLRISAAAENDIVNILSRTAEDFGAEPERNGSVARPEIGPSICTYHLRHSRELGADAARRGEKAASYSALPVEGGGYR